MPLNYTVTTLALLFCWEDAVIAEIVTLLVGLSERKWIEMKCVVIEAERMVNKGVLSKDQQHLHLVACWF